MNLNSKFLLHILVLNLFFYDSFTKEVITSAMDLDRFLLEETEILDELKKYATLSRDCMDKLHRYSDFYLAQRIRFVDEHYENLISKIFVFWDQLNQMQFSKTYKEYLRIIRRTKKILKFSPFLYNDIMTKKWKWKVATGLQDFYRNKILSKALDTLNFLTKYLEYFFILYGKDPYQLYIQGAHKKIVASGFEENEMTNLILI